MIFITINRHKLKWKFLQGLTRKIRENKTTAKITMYTVSLIMHSVSFMFIDKNLGQFYGLHYSFACTEILCIEIILDTGI